MPGRVTPPPRRHRFGWRAVRRVLTFVLVGAPAGGLAEALINMSRALPGPAPTVADMGELMAAPFFILMGLILFVPPVSYMLGFLPAFLTGLVCVALLPLDRMAQSHWILGCAALGAVIAPALLLPDVTWGAFIQRAVVGAVGAAAAAALIRRRPSQSAAN